MRFLINGFLVVLFLSSILAGSAEAASGQLKNLTEVGTFTTQNPHDAKFYKDHLFIADGNSILIYNMSDPENPKLVTRFTDFKEPQQVTELSISEDRLYTAAGAAWVSVLNISDPEKPEKMYQLNYLGSSNGIAVSGGYMYVADANTGLLIFDLYNGREPSLAGMFYILKSNYSGSLQGWGGIAVEVSGDYAFLSGDYNKGFYIIDISNKTAPREVYHSLGKNVYDIAVSGADVYLARAGGTADFEKLNISDIYAPKITGSFSINDVSERSVIVINPSGDYIYTASDDVWHIFRRQDDLPPQIIIDETRQGEISTDRTINVSGTAFDRSGITEVLVDGKFAGTGSWHQTITLVEGVNSINITASDKNGNNKTEILQISFKIPVITTPEINASPAVTETLPSGTPVLLNSIFMVCVIIVLIVIAYLIRKHKP